MRGCVARVYIFKEMSPLPPTTSHGHNLPKYNKQGINYHVITPNCLALSSPKPRSVRIICKCFEAAAAPAANAAANAAAAAYAAVANAAATGAAYATAASAAAGSSFRIKALISAAAS